MLKTLFTTIEEIQDYITVDVSSNEKTILPYMLQAEKYTTEIIGKALRAELIEVVHGNEDDESLKELLKVVRLPLANFGYFLASSKLNVNVGEKGFTVTENQNLAPASKWRVDEFKESVELSGYDGLEDLLEFLEENKKAYPNWVSSKAYSYNKQFFINNAWEFDQSIKTEITRLKFLKLKPFIHQVERSEVIKAICPDLFNEIKNQLKNDNITAPNQILLIDYIRPSVCYLAYARKLEAEDKSDNQFSKLEGDRYVSEMRGYLNDNADNYPLYKVSDCYQDPTAITISINNDDSGLFIGGTY